MTTMLDDLHIVDFSNDVARIFTTLHKMFPREQELYVGDLIGFEEPDEYGLYSKRHESCLSTLIWLKNEGWIRFQNIVRREAVDQCVLTQQAFVQLYHTLPLALMEPYFDSEPHTNKNSITNRLQGLHFGLKTKNSAAVNAVVMQLLMNEA
jgi:hypothetical protein